MGTFYREVLNEEERSRLVNNIANHVANAKEFLQKRCVENFSKCDPDFGARIASILKQKKVSQLCGVFLLQLNSADSVLRALEFPAHQY